MFAPTRPERSRYQQAARYSRAIFGIDVHRASYIESPLPEARSSRSVAFYEGKDESPLDTLTLQLRCFKGEVVT